MGELDGRVVLVTGAARGQGEREARLFRAEGAEVVVADVLDGQGEALAKEIGAHYVHLDVSREDDWAAAEAVAKLYRKRVPLGRIGRPDEVARLALFLSCEDSSHITGQPFVIDGGRLAGVSL